MMRAWLIPGFFMKKIQLHIPDVTTVSTLDRGFNYGDGFFTTAKVIDGTIELWPLHRERLRQCQQRLFFPELDLDDLTTKLMHYVAECKLAVVKVVITRGVGGRGYSAPEDTQPQAFVTVTPFPIHYETWQQSGVALSIAQTRLGLQPLLAGLKTLNRLEQVLIKEEIRHNSAQDALVLNVSGNVIETSIANIIAVRNGRFYTPDLTQSGILGVFLQHLSCINTIEIIKMTLEDIYSMDAVFCCNSLMGLVPIKSISNQCYDLTLANKWRTELNPSAY